MLTLLDKLRQPVARIEVSGRCGDYRIGRLVIEWLPPDLKAALAEYTEVIESQMLSFIDEARERVLSFGLSAIDDNSERALKVEDLQISSARTVAIKLEACVRVRS